MEVSLRLSIRFKHATLVMNLSDFLKEFQYDREGLYITLGRNTGHFIFKQIFIMYSEITIVPPNLFTRSRGNGAKRPKGNYAI